MDQWWAINNKGDAVRRLKREKEKLLKSPFPGFIAEPTLNANGVDWFNWKCAIPGPKDTIWEGGLYKLRMSFEDDFPFKPPKCRFDPPIFHPNVYSSGIVSLSLFEKNRADWTPAFSIGQILIVLQELLANPNMADLTQDEACRVYFEDRQEYERRVLEQAQRFSHEVVQMEMLNN